MAGSKVGRGGQGGGSLAALNRRYAKEPGQTTGGDGLQGVFAPGYDNNGNPQVVKWQGQDDDKAARYLAKIHNEVNPQDYNEGYNIYNSDYQRFSIAMGLNDKPTVLSDKQFDQLVQQNNLQVLYRGESGKDACERFLNANTSHTGAGSYGDGFYFSDDKGTANSYASYKGGSDGMVLRMALAPSARCISYSDLCRKMYGASTSLINGLSRAGSNSGGGYSNDGEAQYALKLGYNVVTCGPGYYYALTRDAFIVSKTYKHSF